LTTFYKLGAWQLNRSKHKLDYLFINDIPNKKSAVFDLAQDNK